MTDPQSFVPPANSRFRGRTPLPVVITDADGTPTGLSLSSSTGTNVVVTVNQSGETLLAASSTRVGFLLQNTGSDDIYIGMTNAVTTGTGRLLEAGDTLSSREFPGYLGALYGVAGSGDSSAISVMAW